MRKNNYVTSLLNKPKILVLLVIMLSLIPRLWMLTKYPPTIIDEPANLRDIDDILQNGFRLTDSHWDLSKSRLVHIPTVTLILLGIKDQFLALRITSVILSTLSLIPLFFITKRLTNSIIAFSTSLLFSFNYYFLQFSRVGWNDIILIVSLSLYLFWFIELGLSVKKNSLLYMTLSGIIGGIIFYGYRSGVVVITASILYLVFCLLTKRIKLIKFSRVFSIFLVFFLLTAFPWIITIYNNQEEYNLRLNVVSVSRAPRPYHDLTDNKDILIYQVKKVFNSWLLLRAESTNEGAYDYENKRYLPLSFPPFNLFIKIGFWLGLIFSAYQIKKTFPWYSILALGIVGQIITVNPPNGARALVMLPCYYIFFSLFLNKIYTATQKSEIVLAGIVILSLIWSLSDFILYQFWMSWIQV